MKEKISVLILDKRIHHKNRIEKEFAEKKLIQPEFFIAGDGKHNLKYDIVDVIPENISGSYESFNSRQNSYNAFVSFKKIIARAKQEGVDILTICEDDVTLLDNFNEIEAKAKEQLANLPEWDMLYYCANHYWKPTFQIAENILSLRGSGGFQFVKIKNKMFDEFLRLPINNPIDDMAANHFHPIYNCYAIWPNIAIPLPGYSFCEGHEYDNTELYKKKGTNHVS